MLKDGQLSPWILQVIGLCLLIAFAILFYATGHESTLLAGAAMVLIGAGVGTGAIQQARKEIQNQEQTRDRDSD